MDEVVQSVRTIFKIDLIWLYHLRTAAQVVLVVQLCKRSHGPVTLLEVKAPEPGDNSTGFSNLRLIPQSTGHQKGEVIEWRAANPLRTLNALARRLKIEGPGFESPYR